MSTQTVSWAASKTITIVTDTPGWFDAYAERLVADLTADGHTAICVRNPEDVTPGDIAFYLSCMKITPPAILARNTWNFVVHASDLPKGRGFSPIVWQVLDGVSDIPVTMICMAADVDAGDIVMQTRLHLSGHELNDEIRDLLGSEIVTMCRAMANRTSAPAPVAQHGTPSWYKRRRPEDSRIDPDLSVAAQFDLLRVVDNARYPAFFDYRGHRYTLQIDRVTQPDPDTSS